MKCERGHRITFDSIYVHPKMGHLECKRCRDEASARYRARTRTPKPSHNKRKTHCTHGHPLYGANLAIKHRKDGYVERRCLTCNKNHKTTADKKRAKSPETRTALQFIMDHIPRYFAKHNREECATLLMIQILESKFKIHEVGKYMKKTMRMVDKESGASRRDRSLDAKFSADNDGTLYDVIAESQALWR